MDIKNITDTVTTNFLEINFLLWLAFLFSELFPQYFFDFIKLLFKILPTFIQKYFLNLHIPYHLYTNTQIFMCILFIISFGCFIGKSLCTNSTFSNLLNKFTLTLLMSHITLLILNIINNYYGHSNNIWIISSKIATGFFGVLLAQTINIKPKQSSK